MEKENTDQIDQEVKPQQEKIEVSGYKVPDPEEREMIFQETLNNRGWAFDIG